MSNFTNLFKICFFVLTLCFGVIGLVEISQAATIQAASCNQTDVQLAINSASNNDNIAIPFCTCGQTAEWQTRITLDKAVTIEGQGASNTCITGLGFQVSGGTSNWRITGIKWQYGSAQKPIIVSTANSQPSTDWSIDGNLFDGYQQSLEINKGSTGLIANNDFEVASGSATSLYVFGIHNSGWSNSEFFGTSGPYVFVEDNKFKCASGTGYCIQPIETAQGGSVVFRCNLVESKNSTNFWSDGLDVHGYGHGTVRSARQWEIYGNKWIQKGGEMRGMNLRGGTGRVFSNRWSKSSDYIQSTIALTDYRLISVGLAMIYPDNTSLCGSFNDSSQCQAVDEASCCGNHEGYPCCDQIGRGQDGFGGSRQQFLPAYFWDNKDTLGNDQSILPASGNPSTYILENRDYIVNQGAPSGYSPYIYPHPKRGIGSTTACLIFDTQANTGITFWNMDDLTPPASPSGLMVQ